MKLQGVSVIFALIVLPLILVLTYYIQLLVNTIDKQNQYDVKLLNSTYGAMSAFEINTANEDLSTVSDSLRTIIDASTNIFMNTLSTNLGMSNASKSFVEPYIPALLYTLYDGYYISAPTRIPKMLIDSDGNAVTVGDYGVTLDASGTTIQYREVHTNLESQLNCSECQTTRDNTGKVTACNPGGPISNQHVVYENGSPYHNPNVYSTMTETEKTDLLLKYTDIGPSIDKEIYGQIVYIAKKTNPTDPDTYTTNVNDAEVEIKHVLKTYMPYSARYKKKDVFDVNVIYTLDNYVTVEGNFGDSIELPPNKQENDGISFSKSGYLVPANSVNVTKTVERKLKPDGTYDFITKTGSGAEDLLAYNQNDAKDFIYDGNEVEIKLIDDTKISSGGGKSFDEISEEIRYLKNNLDLALSYIAQYSTIDSATKKKINNEFLVNGLLSADFASKYGAISGLTAVSDVEIQLSDLKTIKEALTLKINERQYELDEMSSVAYYVMAQIFSNWIYEKFGSDSSPYKIEEKDLVEISGQSYKLISGKTDVLHKYDYSDAAVFNIIGNENIDVGSLDSPMEIDTDSTFYSHKLNIIRDSIQYNLNLSLSTYNQMFLSTLDYAMPVMQNEEWEKILNNVSIVSFMQGYNCGLKKYSNYKIVSSTNNEISVSPKEIYYIGTTEFSDEKSEYHRIDCPKLFDLASPTKMYIPFLSKDVKFDKLYDKTNVALPYEYDHKNLACYECINDGNYVKVKLFEKNIIGNYKLNTSQAKNLREAYHRAIGKVRNNLYKMNAVENSQAFEIIYYPGQPTIPKSEFGLKSIKSIEVVLNTIHTRDSEENVLNYTVRAHGTDLNDLVYTVVPNISTNVTLKIDVNPNISTNQKIDIDDLQFINIFDQSTAYIKDNAARQDAVDLEPDPIKKSTMIVRDSIEYVRVIYK